MANYEWGNLYPEVNVRHGLAAYSYHIPLWLDTDGHQVSSQGPRPFRLEAMWLGEKECTRIIEDVWSHSGEQYSLENILDNINRCDSRISIWNKSCFGNVQDKQKKAKDKLIKI